MANGLTHYRSSAVGQTSMLLIKPTASPQGTMLSPVSLPVYVYDTPSCKRMGLEIYSVENGMCCLALLNNYKYINHWTATSTQTISLCWC